MTKFESEIDLFQEVHIDEDRQIKATVVGIMWAGEPAYCQVRVAWWNNGSLHQEWLDEARLVPK